METCKVLIVDDELLIRQGIKHYVRWEEEGFEIVGEASNGIEAMELVQTLNPHIVITDIVMPVMDGEELTFRIKRDYPHIQIIILSSYSNFEYVRSTFQNGVSDYLLKPTLNGAIILKALKKAASSLPNFQLTPAKHAVQPTIDQLLQQVIIGEKEVSDSDVLDIKLSKDSFLLLHLQTINERYLTEIEKKLFDHFPIIHKQAIHNMYVMHFDLYEFERIKVKLKEVMGENFQLYMTVSSPFKKLNELKKVYEENVLKLLDKRFYLPPIRLLFADELIPISSKKNSLFELDYFMRLFKYEQYTEALTYVDQYIDYLTSSHVMESHEFKSFMGNIMFNMTVLLTNSTYEQDEFNKNKYKYLHDVSESEHVDEVHEIYHAFINEIKQMTNQKHESVDENMRKILNYMNAHYMEPLTLKEIARQFHFNPSYLSAYFSANYRIGLNDYLNELRLKKAKELLKDSKHSISDISNMVGYSDHSYFCKVFKKDTGISPSRYRREFTHAYKLKDN